ncbi:CD69 protein, partial [Geococcyx californianus]|nr:CD69 protein [Geococcyx californianus]
DCGSLFPDVTLKCIKDKRVPIGVVVLVAALLLAIIALAAKKCPSCPSCSSPSLPSCPENGIGYREKCFYLVEDEADWNGGRNSCRLLGAHLATINARKELVNTRSPRNWWVAGRKDHAMLAFSPFQGFLSRYGGSSQHWVGLWRDGIGPWKWLNGSIFNN